MMSQKRLTDDDKKDDADDYPDEEEDDSDNEAPEFSEQPSRLHVKAVGQSVRLKCLAKGMPEPSITWSKDGETLSRVGDMRHWTLVLQDLQLKDAGNYTCLVCNTMGCVNFTTQLRMRGGDTDEQSTTDDNDLVRSVIYNETK